jgi:glycosyltransferase involved in cell wall biosynthesis
MILTIITINRNNFAGLEKTMRSVATQAFVDFEYVVIDGASTDKSVEVIRSFEASFGGRLKWISEPDKGIYNAMNKGIGMASGDYLQFLNSGDSLVSDNVTMRMTEALKDNEFPPILYGNMLKDMPDGKILRDKGFAGKPISFLGFYIGSLNHPSSYIKKSLFEKYGRYDESLKIVSDWKWFLQTIILEGEKPVYADIDVTLFDMNGISEKNKALNRTERKRVLKELIPTTFLTDYDCWSSSIIQMMRLKRHPLAYRLVCFLERVLFKIEKRRNKKRGEIEY